MQLPSTIAEATSGCPETSTRSVSTDVVLKANCPRQVGTGMPLKAIRFGSVHGSKSEANDVLARGGPPRFARAEHAEEMRS